MPFAKPLVTIELEEYNELQKTNLAVEEATATYKKGLEVIVEGLHRGISLANIGSELGKHGLLLHRNHVNDKVELVIIPKT